MKPLFIPLRRQFYEGFRDRSKTWEYRVYGPRWNEKTCPPGRPAVLSLGYGKQHRTDAVVREFVKNPTPAALPGWTECYGERPGLIAACIRLDVCLCDLRTKLVGDGCSVCNPEIWKQLLTEGE